MIVKVRLYSPDLDSLIHKATDYVFVYKLFKERTQAVPSKVKLSKG